MDFNTTHPGPLSEDVNKHILSGKSACPQQTALDQVHKYGSRSTGMLIDSIDTTQADNGRSPGHMCLQQCTSRQKQEEKRSSGNIFSQSSTSKDEVVPNISQNELGVSFLVDIPIKYSDELGDCNPMLSSCLVDVPIKYCTLEVLKKSDTEDGGMYLEDGRNFRTILQSEQAETDAVISKSITTYLLKEINVSGTIPTASSKYKDQLVPKISESRIEDSSIMLSGHLVNVPVRYCNLNGTKKFLQKNVGTFPGDRISTLENVRQSPFTAELTSFPKGTVEASILETSEIQSKHVSEGCMGNKNRWNLMSSDEKPISRSFAKSNKTLSSRSSGKSYPSEYKKNVADASVSGKRLQRGRSGPKGREGNEYSRIQNHLRYLLQRMRYESNLIDAYSMEGWRGLRCVS